MTSPLIAPPVLAKKLADRKWAIVDCRFDLTDPTAGRAAYFCGHIPGARYAHLDHDLARAPVSGDGRHPLPRVGDFAATLGSWGISNSSRVAVYDDASGAVAARLWWMLRWIGHDRVYVLDGGIQAWEAAGLPVQRVASPVRAVTYEAGDVRCDWVVPTDRIRSELASGAALVDVRSADRYRGLAEPIDPIPGHVPGACNYPFHESLREDGRFRSTEELRERLSDFTHHPRGLVAMCGSGVTACHLLLALAIAGLGDGRAYIGSWSEWIRDRDRPVATGGGA